MKDTRLVSKKEAAQMLGISLRALNRLIASRSIPFYKLGESKRSAVRFNVIDLAKWVEKYRNEALPA